MTSCGLPMRLMTSLGVVVEDGDADGTVESSGGMAPHRGSDTRMGPGGVGTEHGNTTGTKEGTVHPKGYLEREMKMVCAACDPASAHSLNRRRSQREVDAMLTEQKAITHLCKCLLGDTR